MQNQLAPQLDLFAEPEEENLASDSDEQTYYRLHAKTPLKSHTVAVQPHIAVTTISVFGKDGTQELVNKFALEYEQGGSIGSANGFIVDRLQAALKDAGHI